MIQRASVRYFQQCLHCSLSSTNLSWSSAFHLIVLIQVGSCLPTVPADAIMYYSSSGGVKETSKLLSSHPHRLVWNSHNFQYVISNYPGYHSDVRTSIILASFKQQKLWGRNFKLPTLLHIPLNTNVWSGQLLSFLKLACSAQSSNKLLLPAWWE